MHRVKIIAFMRLRFLSVCKSAITNAGIVIHIYRLAGGEKLFCRGW